MTADALDTIAAIATPPGVGGVGIIRLSGKKAFAIANQLCHKIPEVGKVTFSAFTSESREIIDTGLVLAFKGPHSFTGEDVIELQGHGGPVILDMLLQRVIQCGARLAEAGEFSKRAFLNDKIDLVQAEAIADLIHSESTTQARLAQKSLQGEFSSHIARIVQELIALRVYVEAALDFPEEEIDFLSDSHVGGNLRHLIDTVEATQIKAANGSVMREGLNVVIAGKPNAGKSTLINQLSGEETAIVTDIPGTTRDIIQKHIVMDGLSLHLTDTAGLRDSDDVVEREGVKRARKAIEAASLLLMVVDVNELSDSLVELNEYREQFADKIIVLANKMDTMETIELADGLLPISAKLGRGLEQVKEAIKAKAGLLNTSEESLFYARRRHLDALQTALNALVTGQQALSNHQAGELLAEDLRQAQTALSGITGEFTSDDLLGEIFSSFCIGK